MASYPTRTGTDVIITIDFVPCEVTPVTKPFIADQVITTSQPQTLVQIPYQEFTSPQLAFCGYSFTYSVAMAGANGQTMATLD